MATVVVLGTVPRAPRLREDDQANSAFVKKPGRRAFYPGLGRIWLFPQPDQAVRLHHCHRGMSAVPHLFHRHAANFRLQTTWGTREGADADDNIRMLPIPSAPMTPPRTPTPEQSKLRERCAMFSTAAR